MKPEEKIVKLIDGQNTSIQATVSQIGSNGVLNVTSIDSPLTNILTNYSISLTQTDNVVSTTQTLTKIVNGVTYTRTLSYNAAGNFLSATQWN